MKNKKILFVSLLSALIGITSVHASTILELKYINGPGQVFRDIQVDSDGAVSLKTNGSTQSAGSLGTDAAAQAEAAIQAFQPSQLVRTNPNQFYNPGGLEKVYCFVDASGAATEFAENQSGVDFAMSGLNIQTLKNLLDQADGMAGQLH
jgi:hypothetical protein